MKALKLYLCGIALIGSIGLSGSAAAFSFDNCGVTGIHTNFDGTANAAGTACPWVAYGDGLSFSLSVNAYYYDQTYGGGTGPSNPFYVKSTAGAIKNDVVIGTGASGSGVTTNPSGMDGAYATPNDLGSAAVFFTTNKTAYYLPSPPNPAGTLPAGVNAPPDPTPNTGAFWDTSNTWDTSLSALKTFLGAGNAPLFFFNNNQTNSGSSADQNLAIWAQVSLTSSTGAASPIYFYFTNNGGTYFVDPLGGGQLLGAAGTGSSGPGSNHGPIAGDNGVGPGATGTDYVLSGGQTCLNPSTGSLALPLSSGACPTGYTLEFNNNLGADQAAYAVLFPALNNILLSPNFGGYDAMHIDWRMGCDPNTTGYNQNSTGNCQARSLNNGYEQLFMAAINGPTTIPEPGTLALLGLGLVGLGLRKVHTRRD